MKPRDPLRDPRPGDAPTIEEQQEQLKAAGWSHVRGHVWKAPMGGYFIGPHGAWCAMKRRETAPAKVVKRGK